MWISIPSNWFNDRKFREKKILFVEGFPFESVLEIFFCILPELSVRFFIDEPWLLCQYSEYKILAYSTWIFKPFGFDWLILEYEHKNCTQKFYDTEARCLYLKLWRVPQFLTSLFWKFLQVPDKNCELGLI